MSTEFIAALKAGLKEIAVPERAPKMEAYMKNLFPFFGVMTTERRLLFKQLAADFRLKEEGFNKDLVEQLWQLPQREFHYVAMDYLALFEKKFSGENLPYMEDLIVRNSWWDTVDYLAVHGAGNILLKHPDLVPSYTKRWLKSENIWLNRTAIIFQLNYKKKTDEELLFHCIDELKHKKEFFIQKAIGWALRHYSRTNASFVRHTTDELQLTGLARREALRLM